MHEYTKNEIVNEILKLINEVTVGISLGIDKEIAIEEVTKRNKESFVFKIKIGNDTSGESAKTNTEKLEKWYNAYIDYKKKQTTAERNNFFKGR